MIDLQQFSQKYSEHLDWLFQQPISADDQASLYTLYHSVHENGGWSKTIALNNWQDLTQYPNPRSLYENKFLVSFEYKVQGLWNFSPQQTLALDFSHISTVPIFTNISEFCMNSILNEDLAMIRNIYDLGIKKDLISLESLIKKQGNEELLIEIQESETPGPNAKLSKNQIMLIKDCIKLIENSYKNEDCITFDMNINLGSWKNEVHELSKHIPLNILWFNDKNSLNHLKQHIINMTLPELYMEIKGCFSIRDENLRFPTAYINHGPNPCEWWGLDRSQSLKLFEYIKNDKGFEIYNTEHFWWIDEIYCISKGLKISHTIQQPGDMILINQGTIHWVKNCGITVNSSWNFGYKHLNTLKNNFEKHFINKVIKYKSLIPLHKLSMNFLNLELENLDITLVEILKEHVQYISSKEENEFIESKMLNLENNNTEKIMNCEMCNQDLFRFYYKCTKCYNDNIIFKNRIYYFCYLCSKNIHRLLCDGKIVPVQKFSSEDYKKFIYKLDMILKDYNADIEKSKSEYEKSVELGVSINLFNGIRFETFKEITKQKNKKINIAFVSILNKENNLDIKENAIERLENWLEKIRRDEDNESYRKKGKNQAERCERIKIDRDDEVCDKEKIVKPNKLKRRNKKHVADKSVRFMNSHGKKRNFVSQQENIIKKPNKSEIALEQDNTIKNISLEACTGDGICEKNDMKANIKSSIGIEKKDFEEIRSNIEDKEKINKKGLDQKINFEDIKNAEDKDKKDKLMTKSKNLMDFTMEAPEARSSNVKTIRESNKKIVENSSNQVLPKAEPESLPSKRLRSAAQYTPVVDLIPSKQVKNSSPK